MRRVSFLFLASAIGLIAQVIYPPTAGGPTTLQIVSGNNQAAVVTSEYAQPMTVRVLDPRGYPVPNVPVTFTFPTPLAGQPTAGFPPVNVSSIVINSNAQGFASTPVFGANNWDGGFRVGVSFPRTGTTPVTGSFTLFNAPIPAADVAPSSVFYSMIIGGATPATQTVSVSSFSNGYDAIADSPWIKIFQRSNTLLDISVDPTGLGVGRYFGYVYVNKNTAVPVRFNIVAKPSIIATVSRINFNYVQGAGPMPPLQFFSAASLEKNFNIEVAVKYNNPSTGTWLGVASMRGMTTPIPLKAVCDPRGLTAGTYTAEIQISSPEAANTPLVIPVTLVVANYPYRAPEVTLVSNAASSESGAIAPGELLRVSGANFACDGAGSVTMDDDPATLVSTGGDEVRVIAPNGIAGKDRVNVRYTCRGDRSEAFSMPVSYAAPGLFTSNGAQVMAFNEDRTLNSADAAAPRGSVLTLYGTGIGDGTLAPIAVNIGGEAASLLSISEVAGMPGVSMLKVRVPAGTPSGTAGVELLAGTETAQAGTTVTIQ